MASTNSALEGNDSPEDMVVNRSTLDKVFQFEDPRPTPVQQGLTPRRSGVVVLSYTFVPA